MPPWPWRRPGRCRWTCNATEGRRGMERAKMGCANVHWWVCVLVCACGSVVLGPTSLPCTTAAGQTNTPADTPRMCTIPAHAHGPRAASPRPHACTRRVSDSVGSTRQAVPAPLPPPHPKGPKALPPAPAPCPPPRRPPQVTWEAPGHGVWQGVGSHAPPLCGARMAQLRIENSLGRLGLRIEKIPT